VIQYIHKGIYLDNEIQRQGHYLNKVDHVWECSNEAAVQAIIDSFDPLPFAQDDANEKVKTASAAKRLEFVTQAAGKDAEYALKAAEAKQFDIDASVGVFMQARIDKTGESATDVATEWNAKNIGWQAIGASIAALEDKSSQDIKAATEWTMCNVIAEAAIVEIETI